VKDLETKLSKRETVEVPDTTPTAGNEQEEGASTSKSDTLYDIVRAMSSDDNDDDAKQASNKRKIESIDAETTHKKKTKKVKNKKSSVTDLVRKNQMAYAKFITKKVPKLLRALGVSSHSGSSDEN
jgi:phosphoenolpyruvate carboxylase